ncbi:carboxylesterase [Paraliobacillus quinghaiensis]|uniref:Carboxylesterase n=1 Tax=Paraliobacillus quinghaiensis TaxID=470815 RepID=A0A917TR66_9BACI|nr:alpha/beta fold hydrolase [Paraliobacillus quinghaiensis]GGM34274.1 carboxylesterase [Paraliobacillus quinghaiensis]
MNGCLCIHGFTGGAYEIEPLADYLRSQTDWQIEVPTLPGHGKDLALDGVGFNEWIEKAEEAFADLNEKVDNIYLIGFSMGGMIASYLAAKYDVAKLVLLSPSRKYLNLKQITLDLGHIIKDKIAGELEDNFLYQNYQHKRGAIPFGAYIEFLKCMRFTKPYLQEITCPVLVAQGIQDGVVPYTTTHYLDKEIPVEIEVIYYYDSKHLICLGEDKDVLSAAVHTFFGKKEKAVSNA